ncbi:MAG: alkaline phosphatase family protein [Candidatus Shapirobacteria bacterium]|nr:alkaline phosphatase family protein [Candidatus Shapirobacteria bacterium]
MVKPGYKENSFNQIIPTIEYFLSGKSKNKKIENEVLNGKRYDKVVLILVDAFGWCFWEKFKKEINFLKKAERNGTILKLISQFPSTTTAEITTILTDTPVNEHGMYEWRYFEPKVDDIIIPFKFCKNEDKETNTLKREIKDPGLIFPKNNFYKRFKNKGIKPYYFINNMYMKSPFNKSSCKGVNFVVTKNWDDSVKKISKIIKREEKAYYFLYIDGVDAKGHDFGPNSKEFKKEIKTSFEMINTLVKGISKSKNTLLLITADHGQIEINPKTTIYLNKVWPEIVKYIKKNKNNKLMVPAGGPRDMFLYIENEYLALVKDNLKNVLKNKADVFETKELLDQGFFGDSKASKKFLERLGNLVVLPFPGESVWWYKKNIFEQKYFGHHGGLTKEEMEIPLILLPIG